MLYDDDTSFQVDLPGGKQRLGESSWECAQRETKEEISLTLSHEWRSEPEPRLGRGPDRCNAFFVVQPPCDREDESGEGLLADFGNLQLGETLKKES